MSKPTLNNTGTLRVVRGVLVMKAELGNAEGSRNIYCIKTSGSGRLYLRKETVKRLCNAWGYRPYQWDGKKFRTKATKGRIEITWAENE